MRVRMLKGQAGEYIPKSGHIKIGKDGADPLAQFVHELGHKLDWEGVGTPASPGNKSPEMAEFLRVAKASQAYAGLQDEHDGHRLTRPHSTDYLRKYLKYQRQDWELWARAYMQFIAVETQHKGLLQTVADRLAGKTLFWKNSQWEDTDFAPVRQALRDLLVKKGWMTANQTPPTSTP